MIAADTNVIVRLLVSDDLKQQRRVVARLKAAEASGDSVLLTHIVLAETAWVLEAGYDCSREDTIHAIESLATTSPFVCEDLALASDALAIARRARVGVADGLVLAGCRALHATPLLTFDRKLRRETECELP